MDIYIKGVTLLYLCIGVNWSGVSVGKLGRLHLSFLPAVAVDNIFSPCRTDGMCLRQSQTHAVMATRMFRSLI